MAGPHGPGIADDASEFEDFPDGDKKPGAKRPSEPGLSEDSKLYEDLVDNMVGEDSLKLDAQWLFKMHGQTFGPVTSKVLLEKLYEGEIDAETPIAPEDGEFMALRRYGAFRLHLPKVQAHRAEVEEVKKKERAAKHAKVRNWTLFGVAVLVLGGGAAYGVIHSIRTQRVEEAEKKTEDEERRIREDMIENLMASLTIDPPLIELSDDDEDDKPGADGKRKKRKGYKRREKGAPPLPPTVELTRGEIMDGVTEVFGGLKRCIVEQIQRDPETVSEKITLSFSVNNDGVVQNVDVDDRILKKSPFKDCVAGKLAQLRFRKYIGEVQNVEYPITIGGRR
jgi:hypothetical protein